MAVERVSLAMVEVEFERPLSYVQGRVESNTKRIMKSVLTSSPLVVGIR